MGRIQSRALQARVKFDPQVPSTRGSIRSAERSRFGRHVHAESLRRPHREPFSPLRTCALSSHACLNVIHIGAVKPGETASAHSIRMLMPD